MCVRRVYDALNVLEALDVVSKDKKSVRWRGFSEASASHYFLQQILETSKRAVYEKEMMLREQLGRFVAAKQLFERNRLRAAETGDVPAASTTVEATAAAESTADGDEGVDVAKTAARLREQRIPLPVQLVATRTPSGVECALSSDFREACLTFEHPMTVHDDLQILTGLGLHVPAASTTLATLNLPPMVLPYATGTKDLGEASKGFAEEWEIQTMTDYDAVPVGCSARAASSQNGDDSENAPVVVASSEEAAAVDTKRHGGGKKKNAAGEGDHTSGADGGGGAKVTAGARRRVALELRTPEPELESSVDDMGSAVWSAVDAAMGSMPIEKAEGGGARKKPRKQPAAPSPQAAPVKLTWHPL